MTNIRQRMGVRGVAAQMMSRKWRSAAIRAALLGVLTLTHVSANAQVSPEAAKRIHDRLVGTPPSQTKLNAMTAAGNLEAAAALAIAPNDPDAAPFYNVVLKNFATPWTNRDQNIFAPLNDYTATVIGIVRDDLDFRRLLWDDLIYVPASGGYSPTSNASYEALEASNANLASNSVLRQSTQSSVNGLPSNATAGVITSRAASEAFFIDGTNRAMFRFTLLNHLCRDMEQVQNTSYPPDRIRQDVTRSPGGDSRLFLNGCVGCHNGMDPMAQAFAYYDFDETQGRLVYTPGQVQPKYLINSNNFKHGYVTPNDDWENRWRTGPNSSLSWSPGLPGSGQGAKSLGQELAHSDAFAECQVDKVYRHVCFRQPSTSERNDALSQFRQSNYSLRQVFISAAADCAAPR